jgi:hypothetical protein
VLQRTPFQTASHTRIEHSASTRKNVNVIHHAAESATPDSTCHAANTASTRGPFPVIPTGAGRLLLRTACVRGLRSGGTLAISQPNPGRRDQPPTTTATSYLCHPDRSDPALSDARCMCAGSRSGGTVAISQPNRGRRDKITNHNRQLLSLSSRPKRPGFFDARYMCAGSRSGGTVATPQPNPTRRDQPDQPRPPPLIPVIPTEATRLFPTHGVGAPGRAVEGPWQYRNQPRSTRQNRPTTTASAFPAPPQPHYSSSAAPSTSPQHPQPS